MRICGVELKGSDAIFAIIENGLLSPCNTKKITFNDSSLQSSSRFFYESINAFARDHHIDIFAIKQRLDSGQFSAGGITFKMEALIQLCPDAETKIIHSKTILKEQKKHDWQPPDGLYKYQENSYFTAMCSAL